MVFIETSCNVLQQSAPCYIKACWNSFQPYYLLFNYHWFISHKKTTTKIMKMRFFSCFYFAIIPNPRYERGGGGYMMIIYHKCKSLLYHVVVARKSWDTKSLSHERENTRPLWRVCLGLSYVIDIQRSKIIFTMTYHLFKNRTFYKICIKEFLSKAFLYLGMELCLWMKEYLIKYQLLKAFLNILGLSFVFWLILIMMHL